MTAGRTLLAALVLASLLACSSESTPEADHALATPPESEADDARVATATLSIEGMVCQGCAQAVTGALAGVAGVRHAEADSQAKTATVLFDPAQTEIESLVAAVEGVNRDPAPSFRVTERSVEP